MHEYSVTIGRNVGKEPMLSARWRQFRERVSNALLVVAAIDDQIIDAIDVTTGHDGEWNSISEDMARVTLRVSHPLSKDAMQKLHIRLGNLATAYRQECVALTVGTSELIDAR